MVACGVDMLRVHVATPEDGAFAQALKSHTVPGVELTLGRDNVADDVEVLVLGRPSAGQLDAASSLKALVVPYAGIPRSTLALLIERPHIAVYNLHHNAQLVAEMACALVLSAAKWIVPMDRALRSGDWRPRYEPAPALVLSEERALILGYGAIGRALEPMLRGLGMDVRAIRRHPDPEAPHVFAPEHLYEQLKACRVLVLALPSTEETRGWLGAYELNMLPKGSVLVNVARADIVDEDALFEALSSGHLRAAALDVWYRYPGSEAERSNCEPATRPFHTLPNVVMSPHRAGHSDVTEKRRAEALCALLEALASGAQPRPVDLGLGY